MLEFGQNKAHQTPEEKKALRAVHFYFLVGQAASALHCKTTRKDKTNNIFITLCQHFMVYPSSISGFLSFPSSCHHSFPTPTYATAEEDHSSHTGPLAQPSAVT